MSPQPIDDERLLAEGRALRALANGLLGRSVRGAVDADDLAQEGQLAAMRRPESASMAWLAGTVRNLARMLRRGEARRRRRQELLPHSLPTATMDPAAIAMQAELAHDLVAAVQALEEPFRTAIVMRYWRDLSPRTIAAELRLPLDTVRSQLQRGLERLRGRLDGRHGSRAAWVTPLAVMVRGRSVAAVAVGGSMTWWSLGVLMQAKVLIAAAAVMAAVAFAWWPSPARDAKVPTTVAAATGAQVAVAQPPRDEAHATTNDREVVATPNTGATKAKPQPAFDPTPVRVPPWTADLLVVDDHDRPVADARVVVWELHKVRETFSTTLGYQYSGREQTARQTARTDATGHARVVLDGEAYEVEADQHGLGRSMARPLWHPNAAQQTTTLALQPALFAHGMVLDANGAGLADAEVTTGAGMTMASEAVQLDVVPPTRTDASGHFTVPVRRQGHYTFQAHHGGEHSFAAELFTDELPLHDVTLTFPGSITAYGVVVDADAHAVPGAEVTAWREQPAAASEHGYRDHEVTTGHADAQGRFTIALMRYARYQLLAAAENQTTSDLVWIEPNPVRPHVEVRLTLPRLATIGGRVLLRDGSPLAGRQVSATPEQGLWCGAFGVPKQAVPTQFDMFPKVDAATTDANGAFKLRVHPGTTWTVTVRLAADNRRLTAQQSNVAPGRDDVVLTVSDADLHGCLVSGTVSADGPVADGFTVWILDYGPNSEPISYSNAPVHWQGNHFDLSALPRGERFALGVEPTQHDAQGGSTGRSPLAPAIQGPFLADSAHVEFDFHLKAFGMLPVRVFMADGSPALHARVNLQSKQPHLGGRNPIAVDADGLALLPQCVPGPYTLVIFDADHLLHEEDVSINPGSNPEVVIHLP